MVVVFEEIKLKSFPTDDRTAADLIFKKKHQWQFYHQWEKIISIGVKCKKAMQQIFPQPKLFGWNN